MPVKNKKYTAVSDGIYVNRFPTLDAETQSAINTYNAFHVKEQQDAAERNTSYARRAKMSGAVNNVYPEFDAITLLRGLGNVASKKVTKVLDDEHQYIPTTKEFIDDEVKRLNKIRSNPIKYTEDEYMDYLWYAENPRGYMQTQLDYFKPRPTPGREKLVNDKVKKELERLKNIKSKGWKVDEEDAADLIWYESSPKNYIKSFKDRITDLDLYDYSRALEELPFKNGGIVRPKMFWGAAISGAGSGLSGAATGASIGSIVPGIGTGVGAAVGGAIGLISGIFGHKSKEKQLKKEAAQQDFQNRIQTAAQLNAAAANTEYADAYRDRFTFKLGGNVSPQRYKDRFCLGGRKH